METEGLLGWIVGWELGRSLVPYTDVCDALREAGLPPVAGPLHPAAAFKRAAKHLRKNGQIDKVKADGNTLSFQLTTKQLDEERSLIHFSFEARIHLDTDTGWISCDDTELAETARDLFRQAMGSRTNTDITRYVKTLLANNAELCPFTSKGAAYFVPVAHVEYVQKIRDFLRSMGGQIVTFPVPAGNAEGTTAVRDAVADRMEFLVAELEAAVSEWGVSTRDDTIERATERWNAIRYKVEAYETYLGAEQERLRKHLDDAKVQLKAKALEVMKAKEAKAAAKEAAAA